MSWPCTVPVSPSTDSDRPAAWGERADATANGEGSFVSRGGLTLHALAVAVVAVVVRRPVSLTVRILSWRPLVLLGTISYGLYLWHWPVFLYVDQRLSISPLAATGVKVGVSLVLATASFFCLERPIRLRGLAAVGGLAPALGMVAFVVLGVALLPGPQTLESRALLASAPKSLDDLRPLPKLAGVPTSRKPAPTVASTTTIAPGPDVDEPKLVRATEPAGVASAERGLAQDMAGVTLVKFGEWLCPDIGARCRTSVGGTDVSRQDGLHFTGDKAMVVWRHLLPVIQKASGTG